MVTYLAELSEGREQTKSEDDKGREIREYRRQFVVQTDDPRDDSNVVLATFGLPRKYYPYVTTKSADYAARCVKLTARPRSGSATVWDVEAEYTTQPKKSEDEQQNDDPDDPLKDPPEFKIGSVTRQELVTRSYDSNTADKSDTDDVTNSAGEPFDPPPTQDGYYDVLTITRNEERYDPNQSREYKGAVNSDTWQGAQPRTLLITGLDAESVTDRGKTFWRVTYVLEYNPNTWDLELLNVGTYYLDNSGAKKPFVDDDGNKILGRLDDAGKITGTLPSWSKFQTRPARPFSTLQLPQPPNLA